MGLVLKCSMDPSAEWEGDSAMVSRCLDPMTTRPESSWMEDACFAHVTFSLPDSATVSSNPSQRRWMVSKMMKACSGRKRHFPDLGLLTISYQQVLLPPAPTLRVPQLIVAHLEGWHQGVDWRKSPPFKLPPFLPVPSALPGYNNAGPFNKMVNWFYIRSSGWQWETQSLWLNKLTFNSLLYEKLWNLTYYLKLSKSV